MYSIAMRAAGSLSVALLLSSLTACADSPVEPSPLAASAVQTVVAAAAHAVEHEVTTWTANLAGVPIALACDGQPATEHVLLEGLIHHTFVEHDDAAGGERYTLRTRSEGLRGTSDLTGEEFRVDEQWRESFSSRAGGAAAGELHFVLRLVGRDTKRRLDVVERGRYVVDASGRLVVDRYTLEESCGE